jgi:hypothetical protein
MRDYDGRSVIFLSILVLVAGLSLGVVDLIITFVGHDVAATFAELDLFVIEFIHSFLS